MEKTFNFVRLVVIYLLFEVPDANDLSGREGADESLCA